ncbi:ABC transporter permease [Reichenbachiella versicolor]|uniref:ABC transporter permease n=1 Tax=Reichenbachiella versicolor TaxID=1821036 RepID=UPI000D6E6739|nr:ABC transporter permease [Reichenbachiella versicolor]
MFKNYIKIAWKVLMRRKLYAFVTLFGISLTLTLLFATTVFVDHIFASKGTESKFDRAIFAHTLRMTKRKTEDQSNNPFSYRFVRDYAYKMKTPELVAAYSGANLTNDLVYAYRNGKREPLTMRFTDGNYWQLVDLEFLEGRGYTLDEIEKDDKIVILDRKSREIYFNGEPCVGKTVQLKGVPFRVMGVVENVDAIRFSAYSNIWLPFTHTKHQEWGYFGHLQIAFLAHQQSDISKIQEEFADKLAKLDFSGTHFDSAYAKPKPATMDVWEKHDIYADSLGQFMEIEDVPYLLFGTVILMYLFLPGLNLISLNSTRIMERFPEIGARKSFGATTKHLAIQFMIENIMITLLGALIAGAATFIIIYLINDSGIFFNSQIAPGSRSFIVGIGSALILAILSGVTPSLKLAKTPIVKTLKNSTK